MSNKLCDHMRETGLTQDALAATCGVTQPCISYWLRDGVPIKRLAQVAKVTGLRPIDLRPDLRDLLAP